MARSNGSFIGAVSAPTVLSASGIWTPNEVANYRKTNSWPASDDIYFSYVTLLLHGSGSNGSTTFTDVSGSPKTPVQVAGNAQISTAQSKFGGSSMAFDGSGDFVQYAPASGFYFAGDFTVESWVYFTSVASLTTIFSNNTEATGGWNGPGNYTALALTNNTIFYGSIDNVSINSGVTAGSWNHYAVSRTGSTTKVFVNGVTKYTATNFSGAVGSASSAYWGIGLLDKLQGNYRIFMNGYLDEFRITNGIGRYTADFTPPALAFKP